MGNKISIFSRIINHSWVKPYVKNNKYLLVLVLFLSVLTFFSAGALMFTSGFLISKSATQPENVLLVYIPIVLVRAFGIARPVFRYVERLSSHNLVLRILSRMRVKLYQKLEKQALSLSSRFTTGDLLGVLADDLEHLQNLYLRSVFPSVTAVLIYIIIVMLLGFFSVPFALLMFLLLFVLVVIFPLVSLLVTRKKQIVMKDARNQLYQTLTDAVMGINDWKMSGREEDFLRQYEQLEKQQDTMESQLERFKQRRNFFFQWVILAMIIGMMMFVSYCVEQGSFNAVWIAAFVLVVFPLIDVFAPIPDAVSQMSEYESSLSRLSNMEELKQTEQTIKGDYTNSLDGISSLTIDFSHASFTYDEKSDRKIVDDISFQIKQGERIALLGKSGSGKSTIVKLLLGSLQPNKGNVYLNGIPTSSLCEDMPKYIAVLQQNPHLFDTSVMNNIRLGNPEASDNEVIEVAKQVRMHDYISSLPNGYNTRMWELGSRFSGGERQRIALARILLQKTPIVILDEPTVGLDAVNEQALLRTIFQTLQGKTVIWITHHLVGVEQMDNVLFLENGKFVMSGTHDDLLRNNPRYLRLYALDRPIH